MTTGVKRLLELGWKTDKIDVSKISDAENVETIKEILKEILKENSKMADHGIGHFEAWGVKGFDSHKVGETDVDEMFVDVTNYDLGEEISYENLFEDAGQLNIEFSIGHGGDPSDCGRSRCGNCTGCDEDDFEFTVKLSKVQDVDGKKIAVYHVVD